MSDECRFVVLDGTEPEPACDAHENASPALCTHAAQALQRELTALRAIRQGLEEQLSHQTEMKDALQRQNAALREALAHERLCRVCAEDGCKNCTECTAAAALAPRAGEENQT